MSDPLTIREVIALGEVLSMTQQVARVRWLDDNNNLREGTARHIVKSPEDIGFLHDGDDVREAFMRITENTGMEVFMPVREACEKVREGTLAKD